MAPPAAVQREAVRRTVVAVWAIPAMGAAALTLLRRLLAAGDE
jgi:hypothetical protein